MRPKWPKIKPKQGWSSWEGAAALLLHLSVLLHSWHRKFLGVAHEGSFWLFRLATQTVMHAIYLLQLASTFNIPTIIPFTGVLWTTGYYCTLIQGSTTATTFAALRVETHSAYLHQGLIHCPSYLWLIYVNGIKTKDHYRSHQWLLKRILLIGCYVVYKNSQLLVGFVTLCLLLLWSCLLYTSIGVCVITLRSLAVI